MKAIAGIKAIIFFLSIARKINALQGGIVNSRMINGLVTPINIQPVKYKITDAITMMISGFTCILGVLFLCKIQRVIIKNIWQKLPIASTMGVTESVRRISFEQESQTI